MEETLILYSARDVKHEIPEEAGSNARLFHTFTLSHKILSSSSVFSSFCLQNVEIYHFPAPKFAQSIFFSYLCTRFGCITRSARNSKVLKSRNLSTPISQVGEGKEGFINILKRRLLTLCCWHPKSLAHFFIIHSQKQSNDRCLRV